MLAISPGWPMRPIGIADSSICFTSGALAKSRNIRVSIAPGATALTRTFCFAYSSATDLVNPTTACLLAIVDRSLGKADQSRDGRVVDDGPAAGLQHRRNLVL